MFFTDQMPENCRNCPCADSEYGVCNIDYSVGLSADDRPKECPLREVKHAHWANNICTNCGVEKPIVIAYRGFGDLIYQYQGELNYCPNCGAKMDEEETEELPYDIIVKAVNSPIYYREEKDGKYTGKILKYAMPDYNMATDFELGLIAVFHTDTCDVVDYFFFNDFNKTWALTEEDLKGQSSK